jgi:hypothetical protein
MEAVWRRCGVRVEILGEDFVCGPPSAGANRITGVA